MSEMRDSRVDWIGKCPASWKFLKGKYIFALRNDRGNTIELQLLSPTQKFGVIPQSLFEKLTTNTAVKVKENTDLSQFKTIHKGDFCISLRSFQGGFEYCVYEGVVSPAYQVFYPITKVCDNYYKYLFKDQSFISKMNSYTLSLRDGKNIAFADFGNTYLPIPPLSEQEKISSFLDEKCSEIDKLFVDIQAEIDTLKECKRSIITEKVTKGLNPDVAMKNSGIEWVGEIPHDWNKIKIKYATIEIKKGISPDYTEVEKTKIINQATFSKGFFDIENIRFANDDFNKSKGKVQRNDVLLATTGGGVLGKTYYFDEEGEFLASTDVAYLRVDTSKLLAKFLYYCLTINYAMFNDLMANGSTNQTHFDMPSLFNMFLPLPNIKTQNIIIDYLDKKCLEIEDIITKKKQQLEILNQYKKSMIYEYVTGKKEVV